ncbi:uncharacterized protein F4822DRAFT_430668 [Hypoxylon trugodes]|uniref:uncharacterized protein n=1 Tax=Hypoxylon trugodes TaxID=326681 RepID=UPI002194D6D1|nr:uncharacterized protein F4822DRAFT_430668 [Hypoxylon trugodes]KAI1387920.1 hypothetical protein F4822DRAFT_430668 [Hypoxylon trugodes]
MSQDSPSKLKRQFSTHWQTSTADNNLTLHGFRRFKTTHLLNLRFLETEIAEVDHDIYQAGLKLGIPPTPDDRLGLRFCRKDEEVPEFDKKINQELILKLRGLLQQYDEALIAFNKIMSMDTFSLLDNEEQCSQRHDLTIHEMYETRLLRVDRGPRDRKDPFQRWIHRLLRFFRYRRLKNKAENDCKNSHESGLESYCGSESNHKSACEHPRPQNANHRWSCQSTDLIANITSRLVIALTTAMFLIIPLVLLSGELNRKTQLAVIAAWVILFACVVTVMLRASNLEMMVVTAAYAAILSVFVSNTPGVGS